VLSGAAQATWVSRLPEVREHLHADPGSLGLALLGAAIGSILSMPLVGRVCARYGSRVGVAAGTLVCLVALVGLGFAGTVWQLGLVLVAFGFGFGSWDVAMNIHGQAVESAAGKAWMPRYHAVWSAGGFGFAGIGALLAGLAVPVPAHFTLVAVVLAAGTLGLLLLFVPDAEARRDAHTPRPSVRGIITLPFVLMGVVMACATLVEGAASDWLGIYFREVRTVSPPSASAAYATFAVAMAVSRAAGTWTIGWLGRARAVRFSALVATAGVAVLLISPIVAGAYVGAALWGLGIAIVFPAVVSAAGETPGRSAEAIALVTPIGYAGFLVGPPVLGMIAQHAGGLGNALWLVGALALVMALLAGVTAQRRPTVPSAHASSRDGADRGVTR